MKKILTSVSIIIAILFTMLPLASAADNVINVTNTKELTLALSSWNANESPNGKTIVLAEGDYIIESIFGLELRDLTDVTIKGTGITRLLLASASDVVLHMERCNNITLNNLIIGHDPLVVKPGSCSTGVVNLNQSEEIIIEDCDIFGCGFEGLNATDSTVTVKNTRIHDCASNSTSFLRSKAVFENCYIYSNGINFPNNRYCIAAGGDNGCITFENCFFANNASKEKTSVDDRYDPDPIIFKNCTYYKNGWGENNTTTDPTANLEDKVPAKKEFSDVPSNAFYAEAVEWALAKRITNGTSETTFSPNDSCTRAQIVTFLWNAMGKPQPIIYPTQPFDDVKTKSYYYDAVLWATQQGITSGTSDTTFSPDDTCTRSQAVTFLWRALKNPKGTETNTFQDVISSSYYADAVNWAVSEEITSGTSATTFSPNDTCTRGQIVTFLYRALEN